MQLQIAKEKTAELQIRPNAGSKFLIDLLHLRKDEDLQIEPHPFRDTDFNTDDPFVNEILQASFELKVAV